MALNPNYVPLTPLWEVFTDKDLLTFLSNGYVKFFVDTERTVGKPVYQLTGSPPNYTYTQIGFLDTDGSWRVNMNLQGAFDQVIYGYPLDENGEVQLYFAQFFSSDDVFQFSREGFPNFFVAGGTITNPVDINYIPDGQFRLHTDIPATSTLEVGQVRDPITNVAFGGWTFERPIASVARDFVIFQRIGSFVTNPLKSPRYAIEISCQAPNAGDTFKDLRVKFDDVNKFSSDTDMFTFGITGKVVSSGNINVDLIVIKNFGTGGDATTETNLVTFTLTSTFTPFYFGFSFGANTGKIIGQLNDDYVQLALRFPSNELFDVEFTDALLTPGNVLLPTFNDTTTRQFLYESMFDDMNSPATDGSDIGLPLILTKTGLRFDSSQVGMIFPYVTTPIPFGFLSCDGSRYDKNLYSTDGIPYSRLALKIILPLTNPFVPLPMLLPTFGTGADFVTTSIEATLNLIMSTNMAGATSAPTDGANPTGFTFGTSHVGQTNIDAFSYVGDLILYIRSNNVGMIGSPGAGSGFLGNFKILVNGTDSRSIISLSITGISPGGYFTFNTPGFVYLVWYKVNGAGTIPSVPGTIPIEIDVLTTESVEDITRKTALSINGQQISSIIALAASAIPQSSYFNFSTSSQAYYLWINKSGGGTDPLISGKIGIEANILTSDTKDQVTSKIATSLNTRYFATPDLRGLFLKGYEGSGTFDLGSANRYASNSVVYGGLIGTLEFSDNISHSHILYEVSGGTVNSWAFDIFGAPLTPQAVLGTPFPDNPSGLGIVPSMTPQGSTESRPENMYVHYLIKY
jgi:hypothetical protein